MSFRNIQQVNQNAEMVRSYGGCCYRAWVVGWCLWAGMIWMRGERVGRCLFLRYRIQIFCQMCAEGAI